jgi:Flp pilus assembly protein CpaB
VSFLLTEARIITVEKELSVVKDDNVTKTAKLESSEKELEELQKKTQSSQVEVTKLQNSVQR